MKKVYVVTKFNDGDIIHVEVLGVFSTKEDATKDIKEDMFNYVTEINGQLMTEEIPNFIYQIHEVEFSEELR